MSQINSSLILCTLRVQNGRTGATAVAVISDRTECSRTMVKRTNLRDLYVLTISLLIVIAASTRGPVNRNVIIDHRAGGVHKLLANYQTGFGYKFRPTNPILPGSAVGLLSKSV